MRAARGQSLAHRVILFLYGTLLDARVLARRSGEPGLARRLRPARLAGFARVGLRGTPYPTLIARPGAVTEGALLRAPAAARAHLACYEGPSYRLRPVRVTTARGPVWAQAWVAARWRASTASWVG
ncbi:hypothetical protein GCM10011504_26060 [Siccirubricoccus deserti]|uniref:Gamma-glutamylcyclotransferase n=1 Tax=Siccirubricoccus deserti TaxID=2013562 RepID=A0A9X0UDW6_9PROT|nr:gamma-glutamylcyclotransferase family protein [Siccirubricoccus deserti]MBC4016063.1 gamma-glutamylcyclotransferase [Siccirubricoccus deserti]GGC46424.1 hypothetical protein GCM10011504_26060 [Siccirubricoccus deserti]